MVENGYMYLCSTILYFRNYWSAGSAESKKVKYKTTLRCKLGIYPQQYVLQKHFLKYKWKDENTYERAGFY